MANKKTEHGDIHVEEMVHWKKGEMQKGWEEIMSPCLQEERANLRGHFPGSVCIVYN